MMLCASATSPEDLRLRDTSTITELYTKKKVRIATRRKRQITFLFIFLLVVASCIALLVLYKLNVLVGALFFFITTVPLSTD